MRLIDADKLYAVLDNIGSHCYESNRADIAGVVFAVMDVVKEQPTIDAVPAPNYRVPSTKEWMERYCTKKQLAGYEKRKEGAD